MDDGLTEQQGLYDPKRDERDACGVGFVAHVRGTPSHQIVRQGLQLLENLAHRGAVGCDPCSGDGDRGKWELQRAPGAVRDQREALTAVSLGVSYQL